MLFILIGIYVPLKTYPGKISIMLYTFRNLLIFLNLAMNM